LTLLVLDASVAAKWLVWAGEPLEAEALNLVVLRNQGQLEFLVPDLFWPEIGNILCKAVRRNRCTEAAANHSIQALRDYSLTTAPSDPLLESAFNIAQTHNRSFYDSLYIALAVSRRATLITADEKLANATAAYLPVKWIGSIST
jgi:predicted nucleic acid-binding protein